MLTKMYGLGGDNMKKDRLKELLETTLTELQDVMSRYMDNDDFGDFITENFTEEEAKELGQEGWFGNQEEDEEEPTQSLTIEYRHKETGLNFVRFNAEDNEEPIQLYCSDDNMGEKDIRVSLETLNKEYDEIARYMEED